MSPADLDRITATISDIVVRELQASLGSSIEADGGCAPQYVCHVKHACGTDHKCGDEYDCRREYICVNKFSG